MKDDASESAAPAASSQAVQFLDAIRLSAEMAEVLGAEIRACVDAIEAEFPQPARRTTAVRAVLGLWSLVDVTNRLRELVQQAPGLKKKDPDLQRFLRTTANVETLRHYVQHLRNQISRGPEKSTPVWGVVAWVSATDRNRSFSMLTGSPHPSHSIYTIAVDTHEGRFAHDLILSVNNVLIDVPQLLDQIRQLSPIVERWAESIGCAPPAERLFTLCFALGPPR
jgi:hypothetical protein